MRREDIIITSDAYRSIDTSPMSSPPPLPPSLYGVIAGGGSTRNTSGADLLELLEAKEEVVISQRTWIEDLKMTAVQHSEEIKSYREVFKVQEEVIMVQGARFEALEGKFEAQGEQMKELRGEVAELKALNAEQAETIQQQSARVEALLGVVGDHKHQITDLKDCMRESDEWVHKRQKKNTTTSLRILLSRWNGGKDSKIATTCSVAKWISTTTLSSATSSTKHSSTSPPPLGYRLDAKDDEERLGVARKLVAAAPDGEESKAALELLESGARYLVVQHPSSLRKAGDGVAHGTLSREQLHRIMERRSDEEKARIFILTDFVCRAK
ncbi:hypothetical protein LshimejAT787_1501020 [Lyophyllum shimeji]|uniref:Uncharacterized protein n=1 Tax=Lyophyllum shimeji TaxID=47721 RepID=A0A9P3PXP8_LYOSH|nr:hypothetical protein LshimejAT787_1501020 [Lyophyllum shimeji]